MTGAAGIGKTYLAIDAVAQRLTKGRPSVMMHGRWFTNTDPLMTCVTCSRCRPT